LIGDFTQTLGLNGRYADIKHAAAVAVIAIFDDSDVQIDNVAVFSTLSREYRDIPDD